MGKRTKKYSEEFMKDAVRLMLSRGTRTISEVARELGVSQSMLYRWHGKFGAELDGSSNARSQTQDDNIERLRSRLREVEMENALLKKAAALFAKEMK